MALRGACRAGQYQPVLHGGTCRQLSTTVHKRRGTRGCIEIPLHPKDERLCGTTSVPPHTIQMGQHHCAAALRTHLPGEPQPCVRCPQLDGGPGTGEEVAAVLLPLAGEPVWPGAGAGGGAGAGAGGGAEAASGAGQGTRAAGACGPGPQGGSTQAAVEQTQPQEQQGQEQGQQVRGQGQGQDQQAVQQPPNGGQDPGGSGPEAAAASAEAAAVNTAPTGGQGQGDSGPGQGKGQGQGQAGSGRPPRQRRGSAVGPPAPSPAIAGCALVGVRLTPEEAFFMHHVLGCLQVGGGVGVGIMHG